MKKVLLIFFSLSLMYLGYKWFFNSQIIQGSGSLCQIACPSNWEKSFKAAAALCDQFKENLEIGCCNYTCVPK